MIHGDHNDAALFAHIRAVVGFLLDGGTGKIAASVEPDYHGLFRIFVQCVCPDIQILAMLVHGPVAVGDKQFSVRGFLAHERAHEAIGGGLFYALPF